MATRYQIHPSVGVARVGNSPNQFYLEPEAIGALPTECGPDGGPVLDGGAPVPVTRFKDGEGRIRRQAARFRVYAYDDQVPDDPGREITLADGVRMRWTVHLANKKAAWWNFSELQGDLMFGEDNSYEKQGVPLRNADVKGRDDRRKLIIDPGPRTVEGAGAEAGFNREPPPPDYPYFSFPPPLGPTGQGTPIDTLGELRTDADGRLLVLGGMGNAAGETSIDTFAGGDTWHDDISDGPVYCELTLDDASTVRLDAWVVVGSPKFAPELVNVVTLDDIALDVAVRYQDLDPSLCAGGVFNPDFVANFHRDIDPLIRRPLDCLWVANVPSMAAFSAPAFNPRDASDAAREDRQAFFAYFRAPGDPRDPDGPQNVLWSGGNDPDTGIPMMPLQSGSNSVWNVLIDKFLTLTPTQYFLLGQWAAGRFDDARGAPPIGGVSPRDSASIGNCVGGPMCPGIEVTWSTRNPAIWDRPYHVWHAHDEEYYRQNGLDPERDETRGGGCEPGDVTKRMAIPWQADFFQCTAQFVNYTDPRVNKDANHIPVPPTFYAYWWPPQSPMFVLSGYTTVDEQALAGVPAGFQVYFPRGINSFAQMISGWSYLGFIVNQNAGTQRTRYPYFVERERNHDRFAVASVAVGGVDNFVNPEDGVFWPVWYMKEEDERPKLMAGVPGITMRSVRGLGQRRVQAPPRGGTMRQHRPEVPWRETDGD
jgi:L-lysine 6-oxidase